jgi:glucose-6-phosphate isomerase
MAAPSTLSPAHLWQRYKKYLCTSPSLGLSLDISRMNFPDDYFQKMSPAMEKAFTAMDALEAGAIANPDEQRMVGHYWLRDPDRAPKPELRKEIKDTLASIKSFAADIHSGKRRAQGGVPFESVLVVGIGGSALGPQFVADALTAAGSGNADKMKVFFFDNTDPDGMDRALALIPNLARTLTVVISKSGGTKETRNGMLAAAAAYKKSGLDFAKHAVAITGAGSELDKVATKEGWLARFPMWDWVGGRTSELSAVGLLPAALQGIDIDAILSGARDTDLVTRVNHTKENPAALLALMWYHAGNGRGQKDMVVLPYKDRLLLFSRYLQQLVMESLGKEQDLAGNVVHQGIAVYGNKGSTDQHAYVQQLREGVNNFFITFVEVLKDRAMSAAPSDDAAALMVEKDVTSGDYLHGFFQGTRSALCENGRESITITVNEVTPRTIGILIALFERAVGFYASLININAYHQPGEEAGTPAATAVIALQSRILAHHRAGHKGTADEIAIAINGDPETVYHTLRHVAANPEHRIKAEGDGLDMKYSSK